MFQVVSCETSTIIRFLNDEFTCGVSKRCNVKLRRNRNILQITREISIILSENSRVCFVTDFLTNS